MNDGCSRRRFAGVALAVGAGPAFGVVVGHIVPLVHEGRIEPASETTTLNLGYGALLLALGVSLLRHREPTNKRARGATNARSLKEEGWMKIVRRLLEIPALGTLLAGCGGSQEHSSQGEQGAQEETAAAPATASQGEIMAATQGGNATPRTVAAAEAFLATLDDEQREQASFEFGDPLKSNWINVPTADEDRNGVALGVLHVHSIYRDPTNEYGEQPAA